MKNKKARAFIATLAVTTVVTAQPVSVLHAEESNAGNKESVGSEESKKAAPTNLQEATEQYNEAKKADEDAAQVEKDSKALYDSAVKDHDSAKSALSEAENEEAQADQDAKDAFEQAKKDANEKLCL